MTVKTGCNVLAKFDFRTEVHARSILVKRKLTNPLAIEITQFRRDFTDLCVQPRFMSTENKCSAILFSRVYFVISFHKSDRSVALPPPPLEI